MAHHGVLSALRLRKPRADPFRLWFYTALGRRRNGRDNTFTGLFGLRNTAWAGHIRLKNATGEWRVVVSGWGRIRLCERDEARLCQ